MFVCDGVFLSDCTFASNVADAGGALHNHCSSVLTHCTLTRNVSLRYQGSGGQGGGFCSNSGSPSLINCMLVGNSAPHSDGGGMYINGGSPLLVNCTFIGNSADDHGGGFYNIYGVPALINSAFVGNSCEGNGGGIYNADASPTLNNCILWANVDNNGTDESSQFYGWVPSVNYTCLQGWTGMFGGIGNIGDDPLFVGGLSGTWTTDASYDEETGWATFVDGTAAWEPGELAGNFLNPDTTQSLQAVIVGNTGTEIVVLGDFSSLGTTGSAYEVNDYHLGSGSPCADARDNTAVPEDEADLDGDGDTSEPVPFDLEGYLRFADSPDSPNTGNGDPPIVDMGAYEAADDRNDNGVADDQDIAEGTSEDLNENCIPDECEAETPKPEGSVSCEVDPDCANESRCVSGVCYDPKQRYISIGRNPNQAPNTARRVRLDTGDPIGWIGEPRYVEPVQEPLGLWLADIVSAPHYETQWPEVVHVIGCEIAHANLCDVSGVHCDPNHCPGGETCVQHFYQVQAIRIGQDIGNEGYYSEPLVLHTPSTWGDTASTCAGNVCLPPNGIVGVEDVVAAIKKYQIIDVAPITWLDIADSTGAGVPDQSIGVDDIMKCIDGYQGKPYPGLGPLNCP